MSDQPATPPDADDLIDEKRRHVNLTNTELVQLQLRVIALENLVTALLAGASDETTDRARSIAACISPRPGSTPHHLTLGAAAQMVRLVDRAELLRERPACKDEDD